jgi:tRNA (mo5U34)-methyltransferase
MSDRIRQVLESTTNWYHRIELAPGVVTPGVNDSARFLALLGLDDDLRGKRVLDLGTRDGYFAFEAERRGASEVVAVDYVDKTATGFAAVADYLGSKVRFMRENLWNLDATDLGTFDIVLFLGLLYHLRDPLGALDLVRTLCRDRLYLETQTLDDAFLLRNGAHARLESVSPELVEAPLMRFCPRDSVNKDPTNYWIPNVQCVRLMLEEANFVVQRSESSGARSVFVCRIGNDAFLDYNRKIATGIVNP